MPSPLVLCGLKLIAVSWTVWRLVGLNLTKQTCNSAHILSQAWQISPTLEAVATAPDAPEGDRYLNHDVANGVKPDYPDSLYSIMVGALLKHFGSVQVVVPGQTQVRKGRRLECVYWPRLTSFHK